MREHEMDMVVIWVWVWWYLGLGTQISGLWGAPPEPRYLGAPPPNPRTPPCDPETLRVRI